MTYRISILCLACYCLAAPFAADSAVAEELPWTLRNHYSFPAGNATLQYTEANALWRVVLDDKDGTVMADDVGFEVRLEDGTVLSGASLGPGECIREAASGDLGEIASYTVRFPPKEGLAIEHRLTRFSNRLFLVMDISVTNVASAPARITEISPAIMGAGSIAQLGGDGEVSARSLTARGGGVVVQKRGGGGLTLFHAPSRGATLGVGPLPEGRAETRGGFRFSGTSWQGRVQSIYTPYVELAPGETLHSDRLWVSYGTPDPYQVDLEYAWFFSTLARPLETAPDPVVWVSVDDSEGLAQLLDAARAWHPAGVRHALIPSHWEGRPGSMRGGAPRYPRSMGSAAKALRQAGVAPGITVDPLLADGGGKDWAARSPDGRAWVNLKHPKGMAESVKRLEKLLREGFDFVSVARSMIPDAALTRFGMSRAEADRLAFEAVIAAAGERPVYAAPEAALSLERDPWRAAAASASRLAHYRVAPGAVRLMVPDNAKLDGGTAAAIRLWPGAIELVGRASSSLRRDLGKVFRAGPLYVYPLDAARHAPALWQRDFENETIGYLGGAVIAFPGGPSWTARTLNLDGSPETVIWDPANGGFLGAGHAPAAPGARTASYGIVPVNGHPTVMGAAGDWLLHLDRLENVTWDAASGILRGVLRGPFERGAAGHVYVPPAWRYDRGKVGGRSLRIRDAGDQIRFDLEGDATAFELRFEARP